MQLQFIDGLSKAATGVTEMVNGLNPFVETMNETNEAIATVLLDKGFTAEQILDFVDVSKAQLDEWLQLEVKVRERVAKSRARRK